MSREWLDVPFSEKDRAKALGARWDLAVKRWYAPRPGMSQLARWAALPDLPALLPGEDRSFGSGLFVDLVPASCWFTNARSCIAERDWERVRRQVVGRAGGRCEVSGCGRGEDRVQGVRLEAHERWAYDAAARVQTLRRLVCLCSLCHQATHLGLAQVRGEDKAARAHLLAVTGMSALEADRDIRAAFAAWEGRSATWWSLDLSILTDAGITLAHPGREGAERGQAAVSELRHHREAESPQPRKTGLLWPRINRQGEIQPGPGGAPAAEPESRWERWLRTGER